MTVCSSADCPVGPDDGAPAAIALPRRKTRQCDSCSETLRSEQLMPVIEQAHITAVTIMRSCVCAERL